MIPVADLEEAGPPAHAGAPDAQERGARRAKTPPGTEVGPAQAPRRSPPPNVPPEPLVAAAERTRRRRRRDEDDDEYDEPLEHPAQSPQTMHGRRSRSRRSDRARARALRPVRPTAGRARRSGRRRRDRTARAPKPSAGACSPTNARAGTRPRRHRAEGTHHRDGRGPRDPGARRRARFPPPAPAPPAPPAVPAESHAQAQQGDIVAVPPLVRAEAMRYTATLRALHETRRQQKQVVAVLARVATSTRAARQRGGNVTCSDLRGRRRPNRAKPCRRSGSRNASAPPMSSASRPTSAAMPLLPVNARVPVGNVR